MKNKILTILIALILAIATLAATRTNPEPARPAINQTASYEIIN